MPTSNQDGTLAGLLDWIDWTITKGELSTATARSYHIAVRRVFEAEESTVDLRKVDLEDLLTRFRNLHRHDYTEQSRKSYESRVRQAVQMYLAYLDGVSWRPKSRRVTKATSTTGSPGAPTTANIESPRQTDAPRAATMISFPLPIRPGVRGELVVPEDLTRAEAERIKHVVGALVMLPGDASTQSQASRADD